MNEEPQSNLAAVLERERERAPVVDSESPDSIYDLKIDEPDAEPAMFEAKTKRRDPAMLLSTMMALSANSNLPPDAFDHIWGIRRPSLQDLESRVLSPEEARAALTERQAHHKQRVDAAQAKRERKAAKLRAKGL